MWELMKIYKIKIIFFLTICLFAIRFFNIQSGHKEIKKVMNENFLKLLTKFNIEHDGTLEDIVKKTQAQWLRKPGTERWEMDNIVVDDEAEEIFKKLGFINMVIPKESQYDYCLVLGASAPRIKNRLDFLIKIWDEGVRFNRIFVLTGQRKLDSIGDSLPHLEFYETEISTETDYIKFLVKKADFPQDLRDIICFIDTPTPRGKSRPSTDDTVKFWLEDHEPIPGSCLCISSQPFINYQDSVLKTFLLPLNFKVETVGFFDRSIFNKSIVLDSIARFLYQEKNRIQNGQAPSQLLGLS